MKPVRKLNSNNIKTNRNSLLPYSLHMSWLAWRVLLSKVMLYSQKCWSQQLTVYRSCCNSFSTNKRATNTLMMAKCVVCLMILLSSRFWRDERNVSMLMPCNLHCGGIRQLFCAMFFLLCVSQISTIDAPVGTPLQQWQLLSHWQKIHIYCRIIHTAYTVYTLTLDHAGGPY